MKLHEYQSKKILNESGLPVPKGEHVASSLEVHSALTKMNITSGLVKAQAYTGGRGKAGGVKFFSSEEQAVALTKQMIGMTLVTHQTGPNGVEVNSVLIEEASNIDRELYIAFLLDRSVAQPLLMVSPDGGMDIEEIAQQNPDRIAKQLLDHEGEISSELSDQLADFLGLNPAQKIQFHDIVTKIYKVFRDCDALMLEINPLIVNKDGNLQILDCKFDIDDNAVYRQLATGGDPDAEKTAAEIQAKKWGMTYITLDGNIGCMVNGAGLAMATMDSIKHFGAEPANFLDVGGSASEEAVAEAFRIISSDKNVKVILINIFGGIMKCDTIAKGIISAVEKTGLAMPLVVRLEGTNVAEGKSLIEKSGLNIISATDLADGSIKAVELLKSIKN